MSYTENQIKEKEEQRAVGVVSRPPSWTFPASGNSIFV